jgi:ubiquinone/menaquinone biosynthesis C-methylase UbiE
MTDSGERIPVDAVDAHIEHVDRYAFAARYVAGQSVLDVACGVGYGSRILFEKGQAKHVLGVDISEEAVREARPYALPEKVEFLVADAQRLPLADSSVDVVVSIETLEHVPDPRLFLQEIRRVLRKGGQAIVTTPINETETRFHPHHPWHLREFSSAEFDSLLRDVFTDIVIFSQFQHFHRDIVTRAMDLAIGDSSVRQRLRALVPQQIKIWARRAVRAQGRHCESASIVEGNVEGACVQVALCS